MKKNKQSAEEYANLIIEDDLNRIVWEETVSHKDTYIVREYEIDDGAVIKYEWRGFPGSNASEAFNHRFTLVKLPTKNPEKFKTGVIKEIGFPH